MRNLSINVYRLYGVTTIPFTLCKVTLYFDAFSIVPIYCYIRKVISAEENNVVYSATHHPKRMLPLTFTAKTALGFQIALYIVVNAINFLYY